MEKDIWAYTYISTSFYDISPLRILKEWFVCYLSFAILENAGGTLLGEVNILETEGYSHFVVHIFGITCYMNINIIRKILGNTLDFISLVGLLIGNESI